MSTSTRKVLSAYYRLMNLQADASHWSRDTTIIKPLLLPQRGVRTYEPDQLIAVLRELSRRQVNIRSIGILRLPDLVSSYVDGDTEKFEDIMRYLVGQARGQVAAPGFVLVT